MDGMLERLNDLKKKENLSLLKTELELMIFWRMCKNGVLRIQTESIHFSKIIRH